MQAIRSAKPAALAISRSTTVRSVAKVVRPQVQLRGTGRSSSTHVVPRHSVISFSADAGLSPDAPVVDSNLLTDIPPPEETPEETFFEGSGGSNIELALSCALGMTLIYAPLTIASIGRRLWFKLKVTNKRLIIANNSPVMKREVQFTYSNIKEIRMVSRAFGAWGDMVIFLKNGETVELVGVEKAVEIKAFMEQRMREATPAAAQ